MNKLFAFGAAALGALALAAFRSPRPEVLSPGTPAPEITAGAWFNHIGRPLNLANLGGNAVLIEFWATW